MTWKLLSSESYDGPDWNDAVILHGVPQSLGFRNNEVFLHPQCADELLHLRDSKNSVKWTRMLYHTSPIQEKSIIIPKLTWDTSEKVNVYDYIDIDPEDGKIEYAPACDWCNGDIINLPDEDKIPNFINFQIDSAHKLNKHDPTYCYAGRCPIVTQLHNDGKHDECTFEHCKAKVYIHTLNNMLKDT